MIAAGSALCGAVVPAWMGRIVNRRADQAELAAAVRILLEEVSATNDRFEARTALGADPGKAVPSTWVEQKRATSRLPRVVGACEELATALGVYADIGRPEWQRGVLQGTPFGHRRH